MPNKIALKALAEARQKFQCDRSGEPLPRDYSLVDTHREVHKAQGGIYTIENTHVLTPRAHMEEHGTLRDREPWLETLKSLMDDRSQTMGVIQKLTNQLLAGERRTDKLTPETIAMLNQTLVLPTERLAVIDATVTKHLKNSPDPLARIMLSVPSVGPVTTAGVLNYIDFKKADSPSALWSYVGLDKPSHARYTKGEAGGGNKTLRTILYCMADSMVKNRPGRVLKDGRIKEGSAYRKVYDDTKAKLEVSEKIVSSRNTQGKLVEVAWKDTKLCHRHGAALRAVMKHFLADLWIVGREVRGLPTRTLYAEQILRHDGIIKPSDRGWKY